ncbi:Guanine nucleotide-binding protein subunit alpha-13 [Schistosoma japonicum]|uniref:Guanine nucleotide-binding protein subunit alpha-13 n=1 Tax=Schistosoma japonicum TaxID=6182 RepID=A0A4Z2DKC1_SCHJA|nr:Guanine nucleotide-binding protein subunit alpha-13 [Schistosoma japonicum]KAH8868246.1 Guanine nucleotide-binding protein subunit alpha-13 [Schistosoma japonicum]TNN16911.1 Guanine nucleotide-binding protein subunit alpha-13 [Schistosoma japonicum]TNN16912.1 Guanine nucleotide-binding protein subunit alpha-13 [Schistosoma japonicum]
MSVALSFLTCCAFPKESVDDREVIRWQRKRNKEIEIELKKEKSRFRRRQMILLLGTGESGKSTFLKQMKIINGKHFTNQEIEQLKDIIYDNIYKGVLFLLQARESLNIPWSSGHDSVAAHASRQIETHFNETRSMRRERARLSQPLWLEEEFLEIVPLLRAIWADESVRLAFDKRSKIITENFSENTRYYLNRLNYIGVENYRPTDEDIVWSRKPTESIIEEEINVHSSSLVFIDVGGQTKERRKWCQCFSDMTSVLFLIASSHYDEHYQDRLTKEFRNKLREAMIVFEGLINHIAFRRVSIIIFFNKTDILKEKLNSRISNIRDEFPNYPVKMDPFHLQDVQTFLVDVFASLVDHNFLPDTCGRSSLSHSSFNNTGKYSSLQRQNSVPISANLTHKRPIRKRMVYRHFTTAVDRRNIETIFNAMQDTVLQNNLRRIMMS